MKKKEEKTPCPVEELFDLDGALTDSAYQYGQEASDENHRLLRAAALQYAALAFKLGAR